MGTTGEEKEIQDRYIPGLTAKQLVWFLSGVISIIITIMMSYNGIQNSLKVNENALLDLRKNDEIRATKIETLQNDFQTIKLQIALIQQQLNK